MDMAAVGEYLRECRLASGLTQEQVAEELGITSKTVGNWENAREEPSFDYLMRLANRINADLEEVKRLYLELPEGDNVIDDLRAEVASLMAQAQELSDRVRKPLRRVKRPANGV